MQNAYGSWEKGSVGKHLSEPWRMPREQISQPAGPRWLREQTL